MVKASQALTCIKLINQDEESSQYLSKSLATLSRRDILKFVVCGELDDQLLECAMDEDRISVLGASAEGTQVCTTCQRVYLPMLRK